MACQPLIPSRNRVPSQRQFAVGEIVRANVLLCEPVHRFCCFLSKGPSRDKRILWRTERDHLLSSPRKRGPNSVLGPRFRGDDNRGNSVTVNRRSCFVAGPKARSSRRICCRGEYWNSGSACSRLHRPYLTGVCVTSHQVVDGTISVGAWTVPSVAVSQCGGTNGPCLTGRGRCRPAAGVAPSFRAVPG
jgi:hypothetical protein